MLIQAQAQALALKAKLFRGFSDPSRLAILDVLRDKQLTVTEIVTLTRLSQSNASNHLGCLRDCGLVRKEQQGRYVRYRLSDPRIATMLSLSEEVLADVAKGVYQCTRYECTEKRATDS
ncbi:winged helix-turn-helix transcriptional regulator [Pleurocapsales cyanobacterium LEGE 06147]|nr:winged helix-turn-helix transcriptional regulator [Pleurocapsales cyanobacterium LEGE 06147]